MQIKLHRMVVVAIYTKNGNTTKYESNLSPHISLMDFSTNISNANSRTVQCFARIKFKIYKSPFEPLLTAGNCVTSM